MENLIPVEFHRERLADVVYAAIREAIVSKELAPGERVTEAGLAKRLNVSKTPVREAILHLRKVGLIEADETRGSRVIQPSQDAFEQAFEMREALEAFTAEKAAMNATPDDVATISDAAQRSLEHALAGRIDDFRKCDRVFHGSIAKAAGNQRMAETIDETFALIGALLERDLPGTEATAACGQSHTAIAEAIAQHDHEDAAALMRAHLQQLRELYQADAATPSMG